MNRFLLAVALALGLATPADAGKCFNRYCRSCYGYSGYGYQTKSYEPWDWRKAVVKLHERHEDNLAFESALDTLNPAEAQPQGVVQPQGYAAPGYSATFSGTAYSYPIPGSTGYFQYGTNPVVQSAANQQAYQRLLSLAFQGAHQGLMDQADLAKIEGETAKELAKINMIGQTYERMAKAEQTNEFRKLEYTMKIDPATGQVAVETLPESPGPAAPSVPGAHGDFSVDGVRAARCASCHSGAHAQGGLDLSGPLTKKQWGDAFRAVASGKMPMQKDAEGNFIDAEDLSLEEQAAFASAWQAAE